jgi:hypothetical protein
MFNEGKTFLYAVGQHEAWKGITYVKIGVTKGPLNHRVNILRVGNPHTITELYSAPLDSREKAFEYEKKVHNYFMSRRYSGEWFKADEEFLKELGEIFFTLIAEGKLNV